MQGQVQGQDQGQGQGQGQGQDQGQGAVRHPAELRASLVPTASGVKTGDVPMLAAAPAHGLLFSRQRQQQGADIGLEGAGSDQTEREAGHETATASGPRCVSATGMMASRSAERDVLGGGLLPVSEGIKDGDAASTASMTGASRLDIGSLMLSSRDGGVVLRDAPMSRRAADAVRWMEDEKVLSEEIEDGDDRYHVERTD